VIRVYDEDLRYSTDLVLDFIGGDVPGELMGSTGCRIARPLRQGKAFVVLKGQEIAETQSIRIRQDWDC
jgi:hypothetical protein